MRILVIGAGALGGYFGGRLLAAGRDVTFLVREGRAGQLAATGGLIVTSDYGNLAIANPPVVRADGLKERYDIILLSCKAFALENCMRDFAPAVGPDTVIIPVLNGMRHIELLRKRFGEKVVLGGRALISATLDAEGRIAHFGTLHTLDFGEIGGGVSERVEAVAAVMAGAGFDARARTNIMQDLWDKWVLIATIAGMTSLMRASLADIVVAGGADFSLALMNECKSVAARAGFDPAAEFIANLTKSVSDPANQTTASLAKDIEKGLPIEADEIIGDLLALVPEGDRGRYPALKTVLTHLKAYEVRRARGGL